MRAPADNEGARPAKFQALARIVRFCDLNRTKTCFSLHNFRRRSDLNCRAAANTGDGLPKPKGARLSTSATDSIGDLVELNFGVDFERGFEIGGRQQLGGVRSQTLAKFVDASAAPA